MPVFVLFWFSFFIRFSVPEQTPLQDLNVTFFDIFSLLYH